MRCRKGRDPYSSASNAACDDDRADKGQGDLHVQVSLAQHGVCRRLAVRYAKRDRRPSDANPLQKRVEISDTPAFHTLVSYEKPTL
jgi:hypothetical protein